MAFLFDLVSKEQVLQKLFNDADTKNTGELDAEQLQVIHASIRPGGISIRQTKASISEICAAETCDICEFLDVLNEMDRRYFLVKDLQWEFAMLDGKQCGTISEKDARFLFQAVYDEFFSHRRWLKFLKARRVPGSGISFAEIEVELCNIPSAEWLEQDAREEDIERGGRHHFLRVGGAQQPPPPPPFPLHVPVRYKGVICSSFLCPTCLPLDHFTHQGKSFILMSGLYSIQNC